MCPRSIFKNPNKAINQEIFVCLGNHVWQCLNLFLAPCDDFTDGAALLGIWQASCANLIQHAPPKPREAREVFYDDRGGSLKKISTPPQQKPRDWFGPEFFLA
jgi:hypothetical protein